MKDGLPQTSTAGAHHLPRQDTRTPSFFTAEPEQLWMSHLAQSLGAGRGQLQAFASLMQAHHWPVDIARLFMDSRYAFARFALAHTSTDEPLRHLALELFEGYLRLEDRRQTLSTLSRGPALMLY